MCQSAWWVGAAAFQAGDVSNLLWCQEVRSKSSVSLLLLLDTAHQGSRLWIGGA